MASWEPDGGKTAISEGSGWDELRNNVGSYETIGPGLHAGSLRRQRQVHAGRAVLTALDPRVEEIR
jgi:hypothetical protein